MLDGLEAVRRRPSMYIGSTGPRGLHHLVHEIIDNSIDEAMAGYCQNISVVIFEDSSICITDDGRGIPVGIHPEFGVSALEVIMTKLHSGGKFDHDTYKVSGGLHGVGISVVNGLSEWLVVEVYQNGKQYKQTYFRGVPTGKLREIGPSDRRGTQITFIPDAEIFESIEFDFEKLASRLNELSFLNKGIMLTIEDQRSGEFHEFYEANGLEAFVKFLNRKGEVLHEPFYFEGADETSHLVVHMALQYTEGFSENLLSYVNNIPTIDGGTHLSGFRAALTRALNAYDERTQSAKKTKVKTRIRLTGEDVRSGLTAIISVYVRDPQFEGQTKTRLGNMEVEGAVSSLVYQALMEYLEHNPAVAKSIISKGQQAAEARMAAKKARELVKGRIAVSKGKLADCSSRDRAIRELFIVEGDSAGGSAKRGRNRVIQAILPLRGKVLNVWKASELKIFKNKEIESLIGSIGAGIDGVGDSTFNISKIRYGKIIIMTDADVDGAHIKTLLLTFFYRYMRPLIQQGYLYVAWPPLYRVEVGKKATYLYDDRELKTFLARHKNRKVGIQRYKGLGEMNYQQLWKTTMNPNTRRLVQITIDDAILAGEIFERLMGKDVPERREFIMRYAKAVKNLDI